MLQIPNSADRPREKLMRLAEQILARHATAKPVTLEAGLVDSGFDSLDMVNLMLAIEAEFDITIAQRDITPENFRSIATIEALIERTVASG